MAITDEARHELYTYLQETIGHERAATLMGHLPPVGWADVATKRDLDNAEQRIKTELRLEMSDLRIEIKAEIAELRVELANLRTEFAAALNRQTYRFVGFTTAVVVGAGFLN